MAPRYRKFFTFMILSKARRVPDDSQDCQQEVHEDLSDAYEGLAEGSELVAVALKTRTCGLH